MRQHNRILGVSFEPWDTELLAGTLSELQGEGWEVHLCVGDTWQVERVRAARKLDEICTAYNISTTQLFAEINEWRVGALRFAARSTWRRQEPVPTVNLVREELDRLFATDHIFSCEERRPYYFPMSLLSKHFVFNRVVESCSEILKQFQPTDVVMIGDNYLAKNAFALLAEKIGIRVHVIRHTRVANFGVVQPFWPDQEWASHFLHQTSRTSSSPNVGSPERRPYAPQSGRDLETLVAYRGKSMKFFAVQVRAFVRGRLYGRILHRKFARHSLVGGLTWVYAASRGLSGLYGLLRIVRSTLFAAGWTRLQSVNIEEPFILVPLHTRPESSSLTQGRGFRDEDVLQQLAQALREQGVAMRVYALENPSSVGDNRRKISRLCSRLGIAVVNPILDTQELIRRAEAVVALSGTALLEAEQVGVPAFAVGHPEFRPFLASSQMSLDEFLARVTACADWDFSASRAYRNELARRGSTLQLGWSSVRDEQSVRQSVDLLVRLLREGLPFLVRLDSGAP